MAEYVSTDAAWSADASIFSRYLQQNHSDYLLVGHEPASRVHIRFVGPFEGADVVWDCHLMTLEAAAASRNFIEIGVPDDRGVPLQVGLALARIDRPAIEKAIIMIRHYKRLAAGRHEYGDTQPVISPER